MTYDRGNGLFLSVFLFCLGVFLLIVFRRNSFKLTVDSMIRVNATVQITKDEIRIAINDNLIICFEIISSLIQRQQRVPHFCQHGDFPLSRITLRHPKSVINAKTAAPDYSDAAVKLLQMCDFWGILPTSTRIGIRLAHVGTQPGFSVS
ncbi:MAG: hypothetical protein ACLSV6_06165 [Butyricicoccus sp.]